MESILLRSIISVMYYLLAKFFFSSWDTSHKKLVLYNGMLICLFAASIVFDILLSDEQVPYVNIIISIALIFVVGRKNFLPTKEIAFWVISLIAVNFVCESLSVQFVHFLFPTQYDPNKQEFLIITISLTVIIEGLIFVGIKKGVLKKGTINQIMNIPSLLALSSIPILSIVILFGFLMSKINVVIKSQLIEILIPTGIVLMNICVLYLYKNLSDHLVRINQITVQNKALEAEVKFINQLKKNQEDIRKMRHDLKNQFLVVVGLLERNDVLEAKEYLQESLESIESPSIFYTRDIVLNYLLNEKIAFAKSQGIGFDATIFLSENINIDNDILAIIIGNLIDNDVQACLRKAENSERDISLMIRQFDNDLLIDINNTFNSYEATSRKQRYVDGIGIRSIGTLVEKLGGIYKHWSKDERYYASVIILNIYS